MELSGTRALGVERGVAACCGGTGPWQWQPAPDPGEGAAPRGGRGARPPAVSAAGDVAWEAEGDPHGAAEEAQRLARAAEAAFPVPLGLEF